MADISDKDVVHTYRVFESDAEGNPVNKSTFGFAVSGEGNVSFTGTEVEKSITITNTVVTTTPGVTPGVTPDVPGGPSIPHKVKTGDNTPIVMWIVVLAVAAAVVGFVVVRKKKK